MRSSRDLLKPDCHWIADGAMGTYFHQLSGSMLSCCETANLDQPDLIIQIHRAYLDAGAQILRTNTFAAINPADGPDFVSLSAITRAGYQLARQAAGDHFFVAADFGPAYGLDTDQAFAAYRQMLDAFCDVQADLFILETFADPDEVIRLSQMIRSRVPDAVIIGSFAVSADGLTRKGLSLAHLAERIGSCDTIDLFGLNCGVGPTHMRKLLEQLPQGCKPLSLMPNGGYPRQDQQRTYFSAAPDYYAQATSELLSDRVRIIGGCCGTSPEHIRALNSQLSKIAAAERFAGPVQSTTHAAVPTRFAVSDQSTGVTSPLTGNTRFAERLAAGQFVTICELDPPKHSDLSTLLHAATQLAQAGIDAITLADSPLARIKVDPVITGARIQRETGIPTMPHLACRDRNVNALRSLVLGAHAEGIRQLLIVTGDGIPEDERGFIKPVFNVNSIGLLEQIQQMNQEIFEQQPLLLGAALDLNVTQPAVELKRLLRKQSAGATLVLTQPLFAPVDPDLILTPARQAGVKVLLGLMPLVSYRNARFLFSEVPGIRIPESLLSRFDPQMSPQDAYEQGLAICLEVARAMRPFIDGYYLIAPFNKADLIATLHQRLLAAHLL